MVVNKSKSSVRRRGYRTHGWGHHKRHRGAGNRGGRGFSNKGKRGQSRKPSFRSERAGATRYGFTSHVRNTTVVVTLRTLQEQLENLISQGLATKKGDVYELDGAKLGFDKVLATGKVTKKLKIKASVFTERAAEKIKAAGGEAISNVPETSAQASSENPAA